VNDLEGESVVFLKVAPGYVQKTIETLKSRESVRKIEATTGRFDLAAIGAWQNLNALQKFVSSARAIDFIRNVQSYPNFASWTRESPEDGHAAKGWAVLRSMNPELTADALRKMPGIQAVFQTVGSADVLARIETKTPEEFLQYAIARIHGTPAVSGCETFPTHDI